MAVDMTSAVAEFSDGKDSVVIRHHISSIIGGAILDVQGYAPDVIPVGHPILQDTETGRYFPAPIDASGHAQLTAASFASTHPYYNGTVVLVGASTTTAPADNPQVGVMYAGEVNDLALKYAWYSGNNAASLTSLGLYQLVFKHD